MSRAPAGRPLETLLSEQGGYYQVLLLVALGAALYLLLGPGGSHFLGEVTSTQLVFARDVRTPTPFPDASHLYFWLVYHLWGARPWAYHLANWALHLTNVVLLYLLARRLGVTARVALASALLFLVHHMTAGVVFVTARFDVLLAAALALGSWLLLDFYLETRGRACRRAHVALFIAAVLVCGWVVGVLPLLLVHACQRARAGSVRQRMEEAVRALAPLLGVLVGLAGLALLSVASPFKAGRPLPEGIARLAGGSVCMAEDPLPRLTGLGGFLKLALIPFDHQPANSSVMQAAASRSTAGTLALLAGLVALLFIVRARALRLSLWWLLAAPLPLLLLQDRPCHGFVTREAYLYLPLMGACLLWAVVLAEASRRLERWSRVNWSMVLVVSLLVPLTASWIVRARQRRFAGQVVETGLRMTGRIILPRQLPKVIYTYLPREIYRYPAFSGGGDLVRAHLPIWARGVSPTRYFSLPPRAAPGAGYDFYTHLGLISRHAGDRARLMRSQPLVPGIDSLLPKEWPRRVLHYHDSPRPGISDITHLVLPRTRIEFALSADPEVKQLFLGGSFNRWRPYPLAYRDGRWKRSVTLPRGRYQFQLRSADGHSYLAPGPVEGCAAAGGRCSSLQVVNHALPWGLQQRAGSRAHRQILALRQKLLLAPGDSRTRRKLAELYGRLGFAGAARLERLEAGATRLERLEAGAVGGGRGP